MSTSTYVDTIKTNQAKDALGVRHIQAVLLGGALLVNFVQQGNVGIPAVAIAGDQKYIQDLDWMDEHINTLTSKGTYFYALMVSLLVAGYLSTKLDVKLMLLVSTFTGTLITYLTPTLIFYYGFVALPFIRFSQGALKGFVKPLVYAQLVRWLPPDELMLTGPLVLSSIYIGHGAMLIMGGYLTTGQGGWPSIFYFSGNIGLIWCLAYIGLGSQSPNSCFYISIYERRYIEESLPQSIRSPYRQVIPWRKILTCVPLYALMFPQSANNYSVRSFIKIVPLIYQNFLQLNIQHVGLILGLPFFCAGSLVYLNYYLVKFLINRRILNHSEVRHVFNGIGQFGAFYFFMYCAFSENYYVSITFHCIGMLLSSCQFNGYYMNFFDLSPNFVGVIVGFVCAFAHAFSILGPHISNWLYLYYYENPSGPQSIIQAKEAIYFFIAMFSFASGLVWELIGSTKIQPFNDIHDEEGSGNSLFNETEVIKT